MSERKTQSVLTALYAALRQADTSGEDEAAIALAKRYASVLDDDPSQAKSIGPMLLDCLRELGMTPRARKSVVRGGSGDGGESRTKLDELRQRRERASSGQG